MPGTPAMPGPEMFSITRAGRKEMPRTPRGGAATPSRTIVPGCSGLKVLATRMGMARERTGAMVLGCRTLEPKKASSMASSKLTSGRGKASGTMRGSALNTPSTSVQISTRSASRAAAARAAV